MPCPTPHKHSLTIQRNARFSCFAVASEFHTATNGTTAPSSLPGTACRAPTEKNAIASQPSINDPAALLRRHRQECLCYQKQRAAASLQPPLNSQRALPFVPLASARICHSSSRHAQLRALQIPNLRAPADPRHSRNAPHPRRHRRTHHARRRLESLRRTELSRRVGRRAPHLDRRPLDRPRRARQRQQGSDRAAPGPEIFARRSLAHRTLDAARILRLARPMARAHIRNRRRHPHPRARSIPRARRLRALLHVANSAGEFGPLNAAACDYIVRAIEWSRRQTRSDQRAAIAQREARRARDWDRTADAALDAVFTP